MLSKLRQRDHDNLWNRLARDLIYDAKQVLLYCGVQVSEPKQNGPMTPYGIALLAFAEFLKGCYLPQSIRCGYNPNQRASSVSSAFSTRIC
jgi:hypothetical protein